MLKIKPPINLVQTVTKAIFEAILTGELRPGDKLSQEQLADKLGVSRQPVVQALGILLENNILCYLDKKSLTVVNTDYSNQINLLEIRCELDCLAARSASSQAKKMTFTQGQLLLVGKLKSLIKESKADHNDTTHTYKVHRDIEFHELIRELSGNEYIQRVLGPHLLHLHRLVHMIIPHRYHQAVWKEHDEILEAILDGNAEHAEIITRKNIKSSADAIAAFS